jgi:hypothetical protein
VAGATLGRWLARHLSRRSHAHQVAAATPSAALLATLQPADVLLVEGQSRFSTAIKYLTQSTWSHAALYVGDDPRLSAAGHCFVEADINDGVRSIGIEEFRDHHVRICRPVGLGAAERAAVIAHAVARIGHKYDLRNVFDLARYLLPTPPVPAMLRRRMLAFGSGDPTRAICSTLVAQAFQSVGYPILPLVEARDADAPGCPGCIEEILHVRHHSLFAPRDFDVSPFFLIVKPGLEALSQRRTGMLPG